MMSEGLTMWVGIILGIALTGLLMFVLYQQAGLPGSAAVGQAETNQATNSPAKGQSAPEVEPAAATPPTPPPVLVEKPVATTESRQQRESVPSAMNLPDAITLSAEELQNLSAEERMRYEQLLDNYHEMQVQVIQLGQEREQLKQRMDKITREDAVIEHELQQIRDTLKKQE